MVKMKGLILIMLGILSVSSYNLKQRFPHKKPDLMYEHLEALAHHRRLSYAPIKMGQSPPESYFHQEKVHDESDHVNHRRAAASRKGPRKFDDSLLTKEMNGYEDSIARPNVNAGVDIMHGNSQRRAMNTFEETQQKPTVINLAYDQDDSSPKHGLSYTMEAHYEDGAGPRRAAEETNDVDPFYYDPDNTPTTDAKFEGPKAPKYDDHHFEEMDSYYVEDQGGNGEEKPRRGLREERAFNGWGKMHHLRDGKPHDPRDVRRRRMAETIDQTHLEKGPFGPKYSSKRMEKFMNNDFKGVSDPITEMFNDATYGSRSYDTSNDYFPHQDPRNFEMTYPEGEDIGPEIEKMWRRKLNIPITAEDLPTASDPWRTTYFDKHNSDVPPDYHHKEHDQRPNMLLEYFDPNEVCSAEDGACGISEEEEELEFEENENTVPDEPKENENTIPDEPKYTEEDIKGTIFDDLLSYISNKGEFNLEDFFDASIVDELLSQENKFGKTNFKDSRQNFENMTKKGPSGANAEKTSLNNVEFDDIDKCSYCH